jgi:hypothetical protein
MEGLPKGEEVSEIECKSAEDIQSKLKDLLKTLITVGEIDKKDIVILGGHSMGNSSLGPEKRLKLGKWIIDSTKEPVKDPIRYHTYMKFKGCESPVVILIDYDQENPRWDKTGTLIAMSRARSLLYVFKKSW